MIVSRFCLATIGVCVFGASASVGALFYFHYFTKGYFVMAKIIISREKQFSGCAQSHNVYLVNNFIGTLESGGSLEIPVGVGSHMLSFKSNLKKLGKDSSFVVVVNSEDEIVNLITYFSIDGYIIKYADNKPHIPTYTLPPTTIQSNTISQPQTSLISHNNPPQTNYEPAPIKRQYQFCCPRCDSTNVTPISETKTEGKDFNAGNACCGILLCGLPGLLFGFVGKGKQTTTTTYWVCKNCGCKFEL